jgi:hypothetical protein
MIKRRYYDMRVGGVTVAPFIQLSNFLMLSYLTINELIPIWVFAPLFVVSILLTFTLIGNKFRKIQTSTDFNMQYEKATENARTDYIMMLGIKEMIDSSGGYYPNGFIERIEYLKKIMEGKL